MRIAVTGAAGQLGWELCRQLGAEAIPLDRERLDLLDAQAVRQTLLAERPQAVINAAAYTAVDKAEQEAKLALRVNGEAVATLAEVCRELDAPLVQVSTDYVFGAPSATRAPRREDDELLAQGVYAQSKLAGEQAAARWRKHIIARTCGLYGKAPPGKRPNNFVETMLRLAGERDSLRIVNDQFCTPSYVPHVARALIFLARGSAYGVYHVVNAGQTNWHEFAAEIFRLTHKPMKLERITTAQYNAPAPRPSFSVLDTSKYQALGGPALPDWRLALAEYLAARAA